MSALLCRARYAALSSAADAAITMIAAGSPSIALATLAGSHLFKLAFRQTQPQLPADADVTACEP